MATQHASASSSGIKDIVCITGIVIAMMWAGCVSGSVYFTDLSSCLEVLNMTATAGNMGTSFFQLQHAAAPMH